MTSKTDKKPATSAWSPFRHKAFALLWTATLVSNTGTWMHDVGAGWLITDLSASPTVVALVQAATTLPIFLFALLAGALADRVDKKRYLLTVNALLFVVVTAMAYIVNTNLMTPVLLLAFTFLIGTGAAFMAPAWAAIVPALVPRENLAPAIALNSLGINISRAIGPAIAGSLITIVGLSGPFFANALSFFVIFAALLFWCPTSTAPARQPRPENGYWQSIGEGIRHARGNSRLKQTLVRALAYFIPASGFWALLPLVARALPNSSAETYGLMLASVGLGAVFGALLLPRLRQKISLNQQSLLGCLILGVAIIGLVYAQDQHPAFIATFAAGLGWISVLTAMHVSAQTALPDHVRARGLSILLMAFYGGMALGATLTGLLADIVNLETALLAAGILVILNLGLGGRLKLNEG